MRIVEANVDFNPILRVSDAIRDDGIDMGGVMQTKSYPRWWREIANPFWDYPKKPSFYHHGWLADLNGLELCFETIDHHYDRVSTINERHYQLSGTGWAVTWGFEVGSYSVRGVEQHLGVLMGFRGYVRHAVLTGDRDQFEREMMLLRIVFNHREMTGRSTGYSPDLHMDRPVPVRVI